METKKVLTPLPQRTAFNLVRTYKDTLALNSSHVVFTAPRMDSDGILGDEKKLTLRKHLSRLKDLSFRGIHVRDLSTRSDCCQAERTGTDIDSLAMNLLSLPKSHYLGVRLEIWCPVVPPQVTSNITLITSRQAIGMDLSRGIQIWKRLMLIWRK